MLKREGLDHGFDGGRTKALRVSSGRQPDTELAVEKSSYSSNIKLTPEASQLLFGHIWAVSPYFLFWK